MVLSDETLHANDLRMNRSVASVFSAIFVGLLLPASALADVWCAGGTSTYCCFQERSLTLTWTYKSNWESFRNYKALRYDAAGAIRYQRDIAGGFVHTSTNTVDVVRRTAIRNRESGSTSWAMNQWAKTHC